MTTPFPEPGPRVFSVPPGLPFPEVLAEGVLHRLGDDPAALADVEIIVSTQRAVRALRSAFVRAAGGVSLGPRLRTLGDFSHDAQAPTDAPPSIDGVRRLLILTRLVRALLENEPALGAPTVAPKLAGDLAALLDSMQAAGASLDGLDAIGEGERAQHWALSQRFLGIIRELWPTLLSAEDRLDPEDRRRRVVEALSHAWVERPPAHPVIVAGSTGSLDTSAWFISLVAALPQGAVVLPGLDGAMDASAADELLSGRTPEHPQAGMFALCDRIGVAPDAVLPWCDDPRPHAQARLHWLSQAMRPAPVTDAWRNDAEPLTADAAEATRDLTLIEAGSPRDEAAAIAVVLREALETPDKRAALITPDRTLARRVAAELGRWGIVPDDSGGRPLSLTAPGVFFSLVAEAALMGMKPATLLALLKHPIASAGFERGQHLRAARTFERWVLRADRLAAARDLGEAVEAVEARFAKTGRQGGVDDEAEDGDPTLVEWWTAVDAILAPLRLLSESEGPVDLSDLIQRHIEAATEMSRRAGQALPELFERAAGETLAGFLEKIVGAADGFGAIDAKEYPGLLGQLMSGEAVREAFGRHPRIAILGPLEARMQNADLVVLAGLNDGVWPQIPEPDPWISRDMRVLLGLPPLESRIGLSAHDFFQAAMAGTAVLSRSRRRDGAPTVASRWLLRLTTLLDGVAPEALREMTARGDRYLALGQRLDLPSDAMRETLRPAPRPKPTPPLEARPRRLSATEVETLIRDPYAVYAKRVLRLSPLPDLSETPDARDRGDLLHRIVERHVEETLGDALDAIPASEAEALYDRIVAETLAPIAAWPSLHALWTARAEAMREWFLDGERRRRGEGRPVALEATGAMALDTALGEVSLTAKADRIDRLNAGGYAIYDYKTGGVPTAKEIQHFAKQLPLEAAILAAAGFEGAPPGAVASFGYLRLRGGKTGGEEILYDQDATGMAADAIQGLKRLLSRYADPSQPYPARSRPKFIEYASDYDHLARYGEWADGS